MGNDAEEGREAAARGEVSLPLPLHLLLLLQMLPSLHLPLLLPRSVRAAALLSGALLSAATRAEIHEAVGHVSAVHWTVPAALLSADLLPAASDIHDDLIL